ncbi:MAG: diacylglycerol kinase family lipid kinase [Actinobacteria bacterium]|nr:diacylglycerol kinase family lipid kinase [Actinomycetota bacterium]
MTGPVCLVVNPAARNGRARHALPAVLDVLASAGTEVRVRESTSLEHAAGIAAEAAGRGETVVAVGGDGLVGTLAAALARAEGRLGIIPAGRGNDFARMLGIPAGPAAAAQVLPASAPRPVDLIGVRAGDGQEQVVAGSVYLGIVAEGGELLNRSRLARGRAAYQLAGLRALLAWEPARFTVEGVPAAGGRLEFGGFCVVAANSGYLAAGTPAAPDADVTDGLLDIITVHEGPRRSFVRVMQRAAKGTHLDLRQVSAERAASVTVLADRPMRAGADGETLACAAPLPAGTPLRIRALPAALNVIRPAGRVPA